MSFRETIDLPLHYGRAPRWLFQKMVLLARAISQIIIEDLGKDYFLEKLSDPLWFQSLGCILGFDWHSSGLTTTVCGALKEALRDLNYGVFVCGGKGAVSRRTPEEIKNVGEKLGKDTDRLVYASKLTAKVDNSALQDGFTLYHHTFIFTDDLKWIVIQQGMAQNRWARRYHWNSGKINSFVSEPHQAIVSDKKYLTLNMIDKECDRLRELIVRLSWRLPEKNLAHLSYLERNLTHLPQRHRVLIEDINPKYLSKIFLFTYERKPQDFETLLSLPKVGPKTLRALALISELIYGEPLSFKDPARFSFAHGGKDGYPYRINIKHYQRTLDILDRLINKADISYVDKRKALRRLYHFYNQKEEKIEGGGDDG